MENWPANSPPDACSAKSPAQSITSATMSTTNSDSEPPVRPCLGWVKSLIVRLRSKDLHVFHSEWNSLMPLYAAEADVRRCCCCWWCLVVVRCSCLVVVRFSCAVVVNLFSCRGANISYYGVDSLFPVMVAGSNALSSAHAAAPAVSARNSTAGTGRATNQLHCTCTACWPPFHNLLPLQKAAHEDARHSPPWWIIFLASTRWPMASDRGAATARPSQAIASFADACGSFGGPILPCKTVRGGLFAAGSRQGWERVPAGSLLLSSRDARWYCVIRCSKSGATWTSTISTKDALVTSSKLFTGRITEAFKLHRDLSLSWRNAGSPTRGPWGRGSIMRISWKSAGGRAE